MASASGTASPAPSVAPTLSPSANTPVPSAGRSAKRSFTTTGSNAPTTPEPTPNTKVSATIAENPGESGRRTVAIAIVARHQPVAVRTSVRRSSRATGSANSPMHRTGTVTSRPARGVVDPEVVLDLRQQRPDRGQLRSDREGAREQPDEEDCPRAPHDPAQRVLAVPCTTGLVSSPIPLADTVTTSPGSRNRGGTMNVPQPAGVPVIRQSPGSSVMIDESHSIATGGGAELLADERVLSQLPVDMRLDPDRLPVGQLVLRHDARPHRAERVEVLAQVALPVVELHRTRAHVVEHRVAEHVVERVLSPDVLRARAEHDPELDLVVDREAVLGELSRAAGTADDHVVGRRQDDVVTRPDDRARELDEVPHHLVGEDVAGLLVAVARVVHPGPEDLPRVGEGREDLVDGYRVGAVRGRRRPLEPTVAVADQRECVGVSGREDGAVHLDAAAGRSAGRVLDDSHDSAPFPVLVPPEHGVGEGGGERGDTGGTRARETESPAEPPRADPNLYDSTMTG